MSRKLWTLIVVLTPLLVGVGCAARVKGEDLGGGFERVRKQVQSASEFEGTSHFEHLYYRGADLGKVGYVSVAPSGSYAIFERNGDIFLIVAATGKLKPVTDGEFAVPKNVRWYEAEQFAQIDYEADRPSSRVDLR